MSDLGRHRLVFVAGLHRSGTTAAFRLLREHPEVSGFHFESGAERDHEGQHLQTVYPTDQDHGGPGYFAFSNEAHLTEKSDLANAESAKTLFRQWSKHWDLTRSFLLEKSPPNILMTRFLQRLFPASSFVIVQRHPLVVSLATMKWAGWPRHVVRPREADGEYEVCDANSKDHQNFYDDRRLFLESMLFTFLEHWKTAHEILFNDLSYLKRSTVVRYEDLVGRPTDSTVELLGFLGLTEVALVTDALSDHNTRYFREWSRIREEVVTEEYVRFLDNRFSADLRRFGYDLTKRAPA